MIREEINRVRLKASDGHILTNGTIYISEIWLAEGLSGDEFYEITKEEYEILKNKVGKNEIN